ncbi:MAG: ABC transporter permease [Anaerolineales bacterium]
MINYIIRRLLILPLTLFGVTVLIFALLMFLSPSERVALYVRDIPKNEGAVDGIIRRYGLDDPIYVQYWRWLVGNVDRETGEMKGGVLRGDLGYSRTGSQDIADMIRHRFPATMELAILAIIPIILFGVGLGVTAAVNHNRLIDHAVRLFSIVGWSLPTFVLALLLLMMFYANLGWFPPGRLSDWANVVVRSEEFRSYTQLITVDSLLNGRVDVFLDALRHLFLPAMSLAILIMAILMRVARSSMLESLRQEYVTTARAKGLHERTVINKHARPNALIPVATLSGLLLFGLLNGVVITETVFNFPGIGRSLATAALQLDIITVLGLTLFNAILLVFANLATDVLYAFIDPRIRLD